VPIKGLVPISKGSVPKFLRLWVPTRVAPDHHHHRTTSTCASTGTGTPVRPAQPRHSVVNWSALRPVQLEPMRGCTLSPPVVATGGTRTVQRTHSKMAFRQLAAHRVGALARLQMPQKTPLHWTPVAWFQRMILGQHHHRKGVSVPVDLDKLQDSVMRTLMKGAPRSAPKTKALVQKALAFRDAVPHGDATALITMFLQSKVDRHECSTKVAAKYSGQLATSLSRLGLVVDQPTMQDFRTGLRAMSTDDEAAQALPMDRDTMRKIATNHGFMPVILMWKTLSRWDDLAGDTAEDCPALRRHVEYMALKTSRDVRRTKLTLVLNLNGLTKQTKPPQPQPQWRSDHYVGVIFKGNEALVVHDSLMMLRPTEKIIPWTTREWLKILRDTPVPAPIAAAHTGPMRKHWTLHSVKVGAGRALQAVVQALPPTHAAQVITRALRHTSAEHPQVLAAQSVCYMRQDPLNIATANGVMAYTKSL
jgi:hypothetical protein